MAVLDVASTTRVVANAWTAKAACRGLTSVFFPPSAERPQARERREALARSICASCPVLGACREFARANHEYGFWGGESEDERHAAGYRLIAPIGTRARPLDVIAS
jgi:WhiB family transcriptional regulator, redox-sensing transcriptional regulator